MRSHSAGRYHRSPEKRLVAGGAGPGFSHWSSGLTLVALLLWPTLTSSMPEGQIPDGLNVTPPEPTPEPTSDRLAEPVLGKSPTQVDTGRSLYYYHCMPCHGDRGQGLTDEWRLVWVEDHQNCWARGCHTGQSELTSFYIPRTVPPVSGSPQALGRFPTAEELFAFLRETQPPQRPGTLLDSEYWALTAFLLHENGRLPSGVEIGPEAPPHVTSLGEVLIATLGPLLALAAVGWLRKRR